MEEPAPRIHVDGLALADGPPANAPAIVNNPALHVDPASVPPHITPTKAKRDADEERRKECKEYLDSGRYVVVEKTGKRISDVWNYFHVVVDTADNSKPTGFVQCKNCKAIKIHGPKGSTTSLQVHAKCQPQSVIVKPPLPAEAKVEMTVKLAEWCAAELVPPNAVEGKYFNKLVQKAIEIGHQYGETDAKKVLPSANTVRAKISALADEARQEILPDIRSAVAAEAASSTHDGWKCNYTNRHYYSLTMHYIDLQWRLQNHLLYTSYFDQDSATADALKDELFTKCATLGLNEELLTKIHFVTDKGANIVCALKEFSWSYCTDHLLNIVLDRGTTVHLTRVNLWSPTANNILDRVQEAIKIIKKEKSKTVLSARLVNGPTRKKQKVFKSFIPMLASAKKYFSQVKRTLATLGKEHVLEGITGKDLQDIISVISPLITKTSKTDRILTWSHWDFVKGHLQPAESDSALVHEMKQHLLDELAHLECLHVVAKCKLVIAFLNKSALNRPENLEHTLKQDVETRWNSICTLLLSFLPRDSQATKVNELLQKSNKAGLMLTEADLDMMEAMLSILLVFKAESVKFEAEHTPTIHLVIPGIYRLQDMLQTNATDSKPIELMKTKLLEELNTKFTPHERHKLGLFLHPAFRLLKRMPEAERIEIQERARHLCQVESQRAAAVVNHAVTEATTSSHQEYSAWFDEEVRDDVRAYLAEPSCSNIADADLLQWWRERELKYPELSKIARRVLATPATSAMSERSFSTSSNLITRKRARLSPDSVEDIMFLNHFLRLK